MRSYVGEEHVNWVRAEEDQGEMNNRNHLDGRNPIGVKLEFGYGEHKAQLGTSDEWDQRNPWKACMLVACAMCVVFIVALVFLVYWIYKLKTL